MASLPEWMVHLVGPESEYEPVINESDYSDWIAAENRAPNVSEHANSS